MDVCCEKAWIISIFHHSPHFMKNLHALLDLRYYFPAIPATTVLFYSNKIVASSQVRVIFNLCIFSGTCHNLLKSLGSHLCIKARHSFSNATLNLELFWILFYTFDNDLFKTFTQTYWQNPSCFLLLLNFVL